MNGEYADFIIAAYGITGTVLAGLVAVSLRAWARVKKDGNE
ncbi:MAG: heme exporter protein CcmD [bacterium]|nr:heme exporter protein CcmD [bacterium]